MRILVATLVGIRPIHLIPKTTVFALSFHRLFFSSPSLRFSSVARVQAHGKTNQSLTTAAVDRRAALLAGDPSSLPPFLPRRRTQHNSSLHLRDILLQCEHCPPPSLPIFLPPSTLLRRIIYSERAKEELWLLGRASKRAAAKTQNSRASKQATVPKTHGMTCNLNNGVNEAFLPTVRSVQSSSLSWSFVLSLSLPKILGTFFRIHSQRKLMDGSIVCSIY